MQYVALTFKILINEWKNCVIQVFIKDKVKENVRPTTWYQTRKTPIKRERR